MSSEGGDFRLFFENTAGDDYIVLHDQLDGTYNPGREAQSQRTKTSQTARISKSGATFQTSVNIGTPMDASQTRLMEIDAAEIAVRCKVESVIAGGLAYSGLAKIVVGELSVPVDGFSTATVTVAFDETPTRGTSPVVFA